MLFPGEINEMAQAICLNNGINFSTVNFLQSTGIQGMIKSRETHVRQ
jgi:hypothetical protein